jgi:hypothetical protein
MRQRSGGAALPRRESESDRQLSWALSGRFDCRKFLIGVEHETNKGKHSRWTAIAARSFRV